MLSAHTQNVCHEWTVNGHIPRMDYGDNILNTWAYLEQR